MANKKKTFQDPAEKIKGKSVEDEVFEEMEHLDINSLNFGILKQIPQKRARFVHPFEGYPFAPEIEIDKNLKVSQTFIVFLNPNEEPAQDPSGRGISIVSEKTKKEKKVNLQTTHNRFIRWAGQNYDVVFDRETKIDGRKVHFAIIPDHEIRCQICYYYDSKQERFAVDNRYYLLDVGQAANLFRLFQAITMPKLRREQMAAMVAGETESDEKSLMKLPTEDAYNG